MTMNVIFDTSHNIAGHVRNLGKAINIPPSTFAFTFEIYHLRL